MARVPMVAASAVVGVSTIRKEPLSLATGCGLPEEHLNARLSGDPANVFFASMLAHELAHSFVARASGIPVDGTTLFERTAVLRRLRLRAKI